MIFEFTPEETKEMVMTAFPKPWNVVPRFGQPQCYVIIAANGVHVEEHSMLDYIKALEAQVGDE